MKSEWENIELSDLLSIKPRNGLYKAKNFQGFGSRWIKMSQLYGNNFFLNQDTELINVTNDEIDRFGCIKNDLIFGRTSLTLEGIGDCLILGDVHDIPIFESNLFRIRLLQEKTNSLFYYYYFKSKFGKRLIQSIAKQTAATSITATDFIKLKVPCPPLTIQNKIAHILLTLDDKIDLNRKMNQTLEAMAQALFKSWFVDFDSVKEGELVESELGMIPKGWNIVKIEEILKRYKVPKRYKKDDVERHGKTIVFEQGVEIILGYHDNDGEFEATESDPMFIFGDHTCVMRLSTKPFSISENVIPLSGSIRNGYWTFYSTYGQQTFQEYRRHWSELIIRKTVLPDKEICDSFAEKILPLVAKIEQNILENSELTMLRDTLLPKLLSGEVEV